tara:strand:- start:83 stop:307 length:225 start_codon:yes stop_codon:yes gene_type:complete
MASKFRIMANGKSNPSTSDGTVLYKEDGSEVTTISDAKDYSTKEAAQAVIDANPSWISTKKSSGSTFIVVEFSN